MKITDAERQTLLSAAAVLGTIADRERYEIPSDPGYRYSTADGFKAASIAHGLRQAAGEMADTMPLDAITAAMEVNRPTLIEHAEASRRAA